MFTKCPEQYRRRYLLGGRFPPGAKAVTGTGVHLAAEIDLSHKIVKGVLAPEEQITEAARDSVVHSFESDQGVYLTEEDEEQGFARVRANAIDSAVRFAALHHKELAPLANPRQLERKWVLNVDGFPFDLAGTIDCDDGDVIWDWKTSGKTPPASEAHDSGQVTVYSLAKYTLDKRMPTARLGYVINTKVPKTVVLETRRTTAEFKPLIVAMERIADAIDKQVFTFAAWMTPRPWWCHPNWCGYYRTCPGVSKRAMIFTGGNQ